MAEQPPFDINPTDVKEKRAVLEKFDGNPTQEEIDSGTAKKLETLVIEYDEDDNPVIVEHIFHDAEGGD